MRLKQFPITSLIAAIQKTVQDGTGKKCLDFVPKDQPSPFYYVEFIGSQPGNSKTMFVTDYTVYIHVISEESESTVPVYKYMDDLSESLTEDISIPDPYWLVFQRNDGVKSVYREETGEVHGVVQYTFRISHGWKAKI